MSRLLFLLNLPKFQNFCSKIYLITLFVYRVQDVVELLGMMLEHYKRLQPNAKTYA